MYTVNSKYVQMTGEVLKRSYRDGSLALILSEGYDNETLSVNLIEHGLVAPEGHIYVKAYSEHEGLPEALEVAGIASKVPHGLTKFGQWDTSAWLMKVEV